MATRPVVRKPGQKAYTLTVYLTDREAKRVIDFARQWEAGALRFVRTGARKSAK